MRRTFRPRHLIAVATGVLAVGGVTAAGAVLGSGLHSRSAPTATPANAYSAPGTCAACPAGTHLDSVEVQGRQGSTLFILRGGWPASIDTLQVSICLNVGATKIVLKPHGSRNVFEPTLTAASPAATVAQQTQAVAAGLQDGALLIDLRPPLQPATPVIFDVALCSGGSTIERLPPGGELRWTGGRAPEVFAGPSSGPATQSSPAIASPSAPAGGPDPTALVSACSAIPIGSVPAYLQVTGTSSGVHPDPRSQAPTQSVRAALAASPVGVSAPFAILAVILPQGASAPLPQNRLIDLAGTEQVYSYFDGQHLHKALRTFQNGTWTTLVDSAANVVTFALSQGPDSAAFYWSGIHPGDRFGFITASATGCSSSGLDATLTPTVTVSS